jgi:hypothetical protein
MVSILKHFPKSVEYTKRIYWSFSWTTNRLTTLGGSNKSFFYWRKLLKWYKHMTGIEAAKEKLLMKYGFEGYGLYNYCMELIAGALTTENINFELDHDSELLAYKGKLDSIKVEEIMKFCVGEKLFEFNKDSMRFTCLKLLKLLDISTSNNPEFKKMMNNIETSYYKLLENNSNYNNLTAEEKRREDNRIQNNIKERNVIPPTLEIVDKYCKERNNKINPQKFIDSYTAKGWMVGKAKMKDWQASIRTWEGNNFETTKEETNEYPGAIIRKKNVDVAL